MFHVEHGPQGTGGGGLGLRPAASGGSRPRGLFGAPAPVYSNHRPQPPVRADQGSQISYIGALLAVLAGIAHAALAPVIQVGGVRPNLVLVVVVLVTVLRGFGTGIAWAFVAGLTANLLVREPLGSIPLALLLVAALVAAGERVFGRLPWIYPIGAALAGSLLADLVALAVLRLVDLPLAGAVPFDLLLPAAVLNAALAGLLLLPARMLVARFEAPDQPAW
jgi:rod shape-determining protein MreD